MFDESNSLSSTNLPDTIWLTNFGVTGEKPGATTKDCCKTGTFGKEENTVGSSPAVTLEGEGATEGAGGEKVDTKDGTTKFGLPYIWLAAPAIEADDGGKPTPEAARAEAWNCKLHESVAGTPPATLELAGVFVEACSAASACLTAATTNARNVGDGTSACPLAWCDELLASLQDGRRTSALALVEGGNSSETWRRSGIQAGCKAIVGAT